MEDVSLKRQRGLRFLPERMQIGGDRVQHTYLCPASRRICRLPGMFRAGLECGGIAGKRAVKHVQARWSTRSVDVDRATTAGAAGCVVAGEGAVQNGYVNGAALCAGMQEHGAAAIPNDAGGRCVVDERRSQELRCCRGRGSHDLHMDRTALPHGVIAGEGHIRHLRRSGAAAFNVESDRTTEGRAFVFDEMKSCQRGGAASRGRCGLSGVAKKAGSHVVREAGVTICAANRETIDDSTGGDSAGRRVGVDVQKFVAVVVAGAGISDFTGESG